MHTIDAAASRFDCVEILGIPALFTVERINRATVPNLRGRLEHSMSDRSSYHGGALRHGDNGKSDPLAGYRIP